jgi:hypothetical protein
MFSWKGSAAGDWTKGGGGRQGVKAMDLSLENDNKNAKTREPKAEDNHRVSISRATDAALAMIVERINDGFDGGKISRTNAVNWIIQKFQTSMSDADIREIRAEHFDELAVLEAVYMRARRGGQVPPELKAFLQKQIGLDDAPKKKKKSLQEDIINDDIKD